MIRNILFDMGGVIFIQDTPEAFRRFREAGIDAGRYLGQYGQKDFFLDLEDGKIGEEEFCRRMAVAAGRDVITLDEARNCWLGFVAGVPVERLHHLEALRGDYHLGMLSNTNPFVMSYMDSDRMSSDGKPISSYFDTLFCSYTMGVCKPSPEIYLKALAMDGMEPGETLFVDDSLKNVRAAQTVGIRGLHVETNAEWMPALTEFLSHQG